MGKVIDFDQHRRHSESRSAEIVPLLPAGDTASSAQIEMEHEAMCWLERHGDRARALARRRLYAAWRNGNHEDAARWQAIGDLIARFEGKRSPRVP